MKKGRQGCKEAGMGATKRIRMKTRGIGEQGRQTNVKKRLLPLGYC